MKIRIEADSHEQEKVDEVIDLLEKAKQRDHDDPIALLIPALKDIHEKATKRGERIRKEMLRRMREVIG
jgi:hypothetical protein